MEFPLRSPTAGGQHQSAFLFAIQYEIAVGIAIVAEIDGETTTPA
jgi:hypothetical protein